MKLTFNFAGSQQLRGQLEHGAPADLFASADRQEMDRAAGAGVVSSEPVRIFARNRLVVIVAQAAKPTADADADAILTLSDLARPGVKIDLADPAVPVGRYTRLMFDAMAADAEYGPAYRAAVLANVVSNEENVKAVVAKVRLGQADAGVVYATDVNPAAAKDLRVIPISDSFNQIAEYPIATIAGSKQSAAAQAFIDFALSAEGQAILARHGFLPPTSEGP